ncbi:hypothetical protein WJX74_007140 [Apatococcus lobatus]|uniref:UDP-glucose/GDP-mannose dehydrogenase dimerisation domain-containing protein n=1 Tax=Apatococcus lobatus TaxID=904363 RepID=A0AAW1RHL1_9CHLO
MLRQLCEQPVATAHQPEFLRAATAHSDAMRPRCIVIGQAETPLAAGQPSRELLPLYHLAQLFVRDAEIFVMTYEEAELCKLYHNGFNAAKISYFNQAARMSSAVAQVSGKPVSMVAIQSALPASCEGLWNSRYGTRSGLPFEGHCLPKDSQALAFLEDVLLGKNHARPEKSPAFFADVLAVNDCMAHKSVIQAEDFGDMPALNGFPSHNGRAAAKAGSTLISIAGLDLLKIHAD